MKYREFESRISDLPVFHLNDVRKIDPAFHRQQLQYWQAQGYIRPLAAGYYIFADREIDEMTLFLLANRIYEPSYVSLESALAYHKIIPESVLGVTSVSTRKTTRFESAWGELLYRSMKPPLIGYQIIETNSRNIIKIAQIEKAVVDYLYLNPQIQSIADFEGLRWNREELIGRITFPTLDTYVKVFEKEALVNRIHQLIEFLHA